MERRNTAGKLAILTVLYGILPLGFISLYMAGGLYSIAALAEPYNLSIIAGAGAYVVFMAQFLLSARIPFIERAIPQDRLLSLHGLTGMIAGGLVFSHFLLKFFLIVRFSGPTLQSAIGLTILITFIVLGSGALLVLRRRRPWKRGDSPPYARLRSVHNLFALAGLLAVVHVLLASSTWSAGLRIFTVGWGLLTLGSYVYHKLIRPRRRAVLKIAEIRMVSPTVHRYVFEPVDGRGLVNRRPGQFGYWQVEAEVPGREEHPFTIASPPGEAPAIVVRSSGDYTAALPGVVPGALVRFDGPFGHFRPIGVRPDTPLVFLAGGIGITPFLSLAGDGELRRKHPVHLLWSVRGERDLAAGEALLTLADSGAIAMHVKQSTVDGRVDAADIRSLLQAAGNAAGREPVVFVCGPAPFTQSMREILKSEGVRSRHIRTERFGW